MGKVEFQFRQGFLAHRQARIQQCAEVWSVGVVSLGYEAPTVLQILGECIKVLWRVERGFLQMIQKALQLVSFRKISVLADLL